MDFIKEGLLSCLKSDDPGQRNLSAFFIAKIASLPSNPWNELFEVLNSILQNEDLDSCATVVRCLKFLCDGKPSYICSNASRILQALKIPLDNSQVLLYGDSVNMTEFFCVDTVVF